MNLTTVESVLQKGKLKYFFQGTEIPEQILLHSCCGPCSEWPLYTLKAHGIRTFGYFFNPNIQPQAEWERRAEAFAQMAELKHISYQIEGHSDEIRWRSFRSPYKEDHCGFCYAIRLDQAARKASELGYSTWTTSLLISPYQNRMRILQIAFQASRRHGVTFLPFDFRPGFDFSQKLAQQDGIYRQKFCGCIYSLGESNFAPKIASALNLNLETLPLRSTKKQQTA